MPVVDFCSPFEKDCLMKDIPQIGDFVMFQKPHAPWHSPDPYIYGIIVEAKKSKRANKEKQWDVRQDKIIILAKAKQ